jgi:Tfp pilus assembly protein PilP
LKPGTARRSFKTATKTKTEVEVGDSIGKDQGKVVEIGKNAVVVEQGNSRVRMRLYPGVVREEKVSR